MPFLLVIILSKKFLTPKIYTIPIKINEDKFQMKVIVGRMHFWHIIIMHTHSSKFWNFSCKLEKFR